MKKMVFIFILLSPLTSFAGESLDIADLMTHHEYKAAGLDKLSPEEVEALNRWLTEFNAKKRDDQTPSTTDAAGESALNPEKGGTNLFGGKKSKTYKIQHVSGETSFEINNRKFEASKKCPGFKRGDEVEFIEGSAYGLCTTALFTKPGSSGPCKVWCEED